MQRSLRRVATVLIVDPDEGPREDRLAALGARGFRGRGVRGAQDAVKALRRESFDVVLVADPKPEEVLRLIREAAQRARIVALGQDPDWETCMKLSALGAMEVLRASLPADELAGRLRALLPDDGTEAA